MNLKMDIHACVRLNTAPIICNFVLYTFDKILTDQRDSLLALLDGAGISTSAEPRPGFSEENGFVQELRKLQINDIIEE